MAEPGPTRTSTPTSGGVVDWDEDDQSSWAGGGTPFSASALTSNGATNSSLAVGTPGFDYTIHSDTIAEGLGIGDYALTLGDAFAWQDWLACTTAGTARITIDYSYTLDTRDTCDDASAYVFMNAFFANHIRVNHLTAKDDWTIGPPNQNGTTNVQHTGCRLMPVST